MTENEIIKALAWLIFNFPKVENAKDDTDRLCNCINLYCSNALDLINRLQADKEALINGQETLQKHIAEQKAEIERLQKIASEIVVGGKYKYRVVTTEGIDNLVKELTNKN